MDETVLRAMAKWPNVPAVYGWLALDRRGNWLIKGERIGNQALREFIARNYEADERGRWFFQNGPQRVFVDLDYTPLVYRVTSHLKAPLALTTHIGDAANTLLGAWIDELGTVLIETDRGIGIVHDQDLDPLLLAAMIDANGNVVEESVFDELLPFIEHQRPIPLWLRFRDSDVKFESLQSADAPKWFGFDPHPQSSLS
jgi:hypothetical protein